MRKKINYTVVENKKSNEIIYNHFFNLGKGLSYEEVSEIIDSIHKYYNYNANTGILEIEYTIRKGINKVREKLLKMSIFIGSGLTEEQQEKIMIDSSFKYILDTGILTIIHKIMYN